MTTTQKETIIAGIEAGLSAIEVIAKAIYKERKQEGEALIFITDKIEQLLKELEEKDNELERN